MFVRPCYRDLFELCDSEWTQGTQGVFLTGAPGVGKSCFLDYVLHRCLYDDDKKHNVLYLDGNDWRALLFQQNMSGITVVEHCLYDLREKRVRIPSDAFDVVCFDAHESAEHTNDVHISLLQGKKFIVAMLPQREHCKRLRKDTRSQVSVFMGALSMDEAKAMRASCYAGVPQDVLQARYRKIGGIARYLCCSHWPHHESDLGVEDEERRQYAALNDIEQYALRIDTGEVPSQFEYLWNLYHHEPPQRNGRPDYFHFTIELASHDVRTRIRDTLMQKDVGELWHLYKVTSERHVTLKGIRYEAYAHKKMLEHGVNLQATSLTTSGVGKQIRIPALLPRIDLMTNDLGEPSEDAINRARRLPTGGYLLPKNSDMVVGDSLFVSPTETLSLQMMAGGRQPMSEPSASLLQAAAAGYLIFVVPDESIVVQELEYSQGDGLAQWGQCRLVLKEY